MLDQEFYDSRWNDFEFAGRLRLIRCQSILRELSKLHDGTPMRIVDLGCGAGWMSSVLGHFGPTTGVDFSPATIAAASERYPHVRFVCEDFLKWQPSEGAFDVVVSQEVIEHVHDQLGYLSLALALLRPNGSLILTTPNATTFNSMSPAQRKNWSNQPIENWLTFNQIKDMVTASGFSIRHAGTIIFGYGNKGIRRMAGSNLFRRSVGTGPARQLADFVFSSIGLGLHSLVVADSPP
jgi:SAM-dependent methyltransferase